MKFENECGCIVDYLTLENAIWQECNKRKVIPKDKYKIYIHRGYCAISIKHDKVDVHRIIGNYMYGNTLDSNIAVHHIDGNKLNNMLSNLQILRNALHTKQHYLVQYVSKDKLAKNALKGTEKIKRNDVSKDKVQKLRSQGYTYTQIAKLLHCGYNTVWRRLSN